MPINRTLTGILAVLFTSSGVFVMAFVDGLEGLDAALLRTGVLLGALWLALPTRTREAAWANVSPVAFVAILIAGVAIVARPRVLLFVVPIGIALGVLSVFLRPRPK